MFVGADVFVCVVFVWEETGVIKREQNLTYKYWDMTWQGIIMMSSISGVII